MSQGFQGVPGKKTVSGDDLRETQDYGFFYSLLHILSFLHGTLTSFVFNNKVSSKNPQHFLKSLLYFPNQ